MILIIVYSFNFTFVAMGQCITEGHSRHSTTRELYRGYQVNDPTRSIMGANTDITEMVEMYRETLRDSGLP